MIEEVKRRVAQALPGCQIHVKDFTGTGDHLEANVIWQGFEGMTRLQQHRKVYEALDGLVGGGAPVHALSIKTWTTPPEELANPSEAYGG